MRFILRSLVILLVLYGLVFAVGDAYLAHWDVSVWWAVAFATGFIGLQYVGSPYFIEWILPIQWVDLDDEGDMLAWPIPPASRAFLRQLCAARGLRVPRMGVIASGTPNAFSFGHTPADGRVVITTGLIDILTPGELNAVLAHEIGHIEHWDMAVMMVASLVPLLLYQVYVFTRSSSHFRPLAYGAYLAYLASQFIVLLLNRTREYFADHYAAEATQAPDDLSSALVKIAYGLVQAEGAYQEAVADKAPTRARARQEHRLAGTMAVMGIANVRSGASVALSGVDPAAAARVMRWDLVNPWARVYEAQSTHPLTARRIRALRLESDDPETPLNVMTAETPRVNWAGFPLQVLLWAAPVVAAVVLAAWWWGQKSLAGLGLVLSPRIASSLLFVTGVGWILRIVYRYRGTFEPATVGELIDDVTVSEMQPRAVRLTGEVLGRGMPGAFWSPDLLLRDASGIIFVLYRASIPFARLFFALTSAEDVVGQQVVIEGWYRRGQRPYVEMATIETAQGRTFRSYSVYVQLAVAGAAVVAAWFLRPA